MKKQSVQKIEDSYVNRGFRGTQLHKALMRDIEYQRLLLAKKRKVSKLVKATAQEKKKYVLATTIDYEILDKCKKLGKKRLSPEDRKIIQLIKSQLKDDWRAPLATALNALQRKYRKNS